MMFTPLITFDIFLTFNTPAEALAKKEKREK